MIIIIKNPSFKARIFYLRTAHIVRLFRFIGYACGGLSYVYAIISTENTIKIRD